MAEVACLLAAVLGGVFVLVIFVVMATNREAKELDHSWCGGEGSPEAAEMNVPHDMGSGVTFEPGVPVCPGDRIPEISPYTGRPWGC